MRRNKFNAKRTLVDGHLFASRKEARRYAQLMLLQRGGVIRGLELQPKFPVIINGVKCFTYIADFAYFEGNEQVVEDAKGMRTQIYRLKKKCVEAMYPGLKIVEV